MVHRINQRVRDLRIFVVSLLKQIERRALCVDEAQKYGLEIEFFDAVDGKQLGPETRDAHYDEIRNKRYFKRPLANGEIACYLSHLELWERIAQGTDSYALILEDDFEFLDDPTPFFRQVANKKIEDVMIKIDGMPRQKNLPVAQQLEKIALVRADTIPARTTGYLIGRNAAAAMHKSRGQFFRTIDNDIKHHWEYDVPVLVAVPQLVRERDDNESGLDASRKSFRSGNAAHRFLRNLSYQARFRVGLATHPKKELPKI